MFFENINNLKKDFRKSLLLKRTGKELIIFIAAQMTDLEEFLFMARDKRKEVKKLKCPFQINICFHFFA